MSDGRGRTEPPDSESVKLQLGQEQEHFFNTVTILKAIYANNFHDPYFSSLIIAISDNAKKKATIS